MKKNVVEDLLTRMFNMTKFFVLLLLINSVFSLPTVMADENALNVLDEECTGLLGNTQISSIEEDAARKDPEAILKLASLYGAGVCVEEDQAKAFGLYLEAARLGNPLGQYFVGEYYYYGRGIKKDYVEAARWYRLSANKGVVGAKVMLANIYLYGRGVDQDSVFAYVWFARANNGVIPKGSRLQNILLSRMTKDQIYCAEKILALDREPGEMREKEKRDLEEKEKARKGVSTLK